MLIQIDLDLACLAPAEPRRQHELIFSAPGLGVACSNAALSHQAQLIFRHRPLEPEKQTIVDKTRIVGAVRINDQCSGKRAKVDQVMPVSPVAGEARSLNAINSTYVAGTNHRNKSLKPGALHAARAGATKIIVDDAYRAEADFLCCSGQIILSALAFEIAHNLSHGRLTNVNDSGAVEVVRRDSGAHPRLPSSPISPRSSPPAADRP